MYCIWKSRYKDELTPVYIGQVKETISKYRMIAHFSRKNRATGSQLEKVKIAVNDGSILGVTFVEIEPGYMRTSIEEWLIIKYSEDLLWNKKGKTVITS